MAISGTWIGGTIYKAYFQALISGNIPTIHMAQNMVHPTHDPQLFFTLVQQKKQKKVGPSSYISCLLVDKPH